MIVVWSLIALVAFSGTAYAQKGRPIEERKTEHPHHPYDPNNRLGEIFPDWLVQVGLVVIAIGAVIGLGFWTWLAIFDSRAREGLALLVFFVLLGAYLLCAIKFLPPWGAVLAIAGPIALLGIWVLRVERREKRERERQPKDSAAAGDQAPDQQCPSSS